MKKFALFLTVLLSQQALATDLLCKNLGGSGDYYFLRLNVENESFEHWKVVVDNYEIPLRVSDKTISALVVREEDIFLKLDLVTQQLDRATLKMFGGGLVKRCDILEDLEEQIEKKKALAKENSEFAKQLRKI